MSLVFDTDPDLVTKHPAEVLDFEVNFTPVLAANVRLEAAIARVADESSSDVTSELLVSAAPEINSVTNTAKVRLRKGTNGSTYALFVLGIMNTGERAILRTRVHVLAGPFAVDMANIAVIRAHAPAAAVSGTGTAP